MMYGTWILNLLKEMALYFVDASKIRIIPLPNFVRKTLRFIFTPWRTYTVHRLFRVEPIKNNDNVFVQVIDLTQTPWGYRRVLGSTKRLARLAWEDDFPSDAYFAAHNAAVIAAARLWKAGTKNTLMNEYVGHLKNRFRFIEKV